jgi:DNA-binding NarL/FixJ family response regulator
MKILVIDDHAIVRAGLRRLLAPEPGIAEILEAVSAKEGLSLFKEHRPDVVVLDLNLPGGAGGLELIRRFRAESPGAQILVFSMLVDAIFAARSLEAGAAGYVSKNAAPAEILEAIKRVAAGERYLENEIAQQVALLTVGTRSAGHPLRDLSARELEILRLLGEGQSLLQIADALGVSYKTVANTCGQMKTKLGAARTADLIRIAVETREGQLRPFGAGGMRLSPRA